MTYRSTHNPHSDMNMTAEVHPRTLQRKRNTQTEIRGGLMTLLSSGFLSAFCQYSPFTATAKLIRHKGYNNISLLLYAQATNTISIK